MCDLRKITQPRKKGYHGKMAIYSMEIFFHNGWSMMTMKFQILKVLTFKEDMQKMGGG